MSDLLHSSRRAISDNIAMWAIRHRIVNSVYSKTHTLLATLRIQNQHQVDSYAFSEVEHLCQSVGCARNERQCPTVPQNWRSLDAGLRKDGIPALDLWDVVIEVLHSSNNKKSSTQGAAGNCLQKFNTKFRKKGTQYVDQLSDVDHVATNANSSQCEAQLCIFEERSGDQNDNQRKRSNDETRVQNPRSRVRLVV